jgi:hypothetical protein
MLKKTITYFALATLLTACQFTGNQKMNANKNETYSEVEGAYVGSISQGNFVWGGAMNLAWTELTDHILKEPLKLATTDKELNKETNTYNAPLFKAADINNQSYYIKSGLGSETVSIINHEVKAKFPDKSFGDLNLFLGPHSFISYAYFVKEIEYLVTFDKAEVNFLGTPVRGFSANNIAQRRNIQVLSYQNDDRFILRLKLKTQRDELYLIKGYKDLNAQGIAQLISQTALNQPMVLGNQDQFAAPALKLKIENNHPELVGLPILNSAFKGYTLGAMVEKLNFSMDEKGARVENEGYAALVTSAGIRPSSKHLILDKPYWIVLKERSKAHPYFMAQISNTAFMQKKD